MGNFGKGGRGGDRGGRSFGGDRGSRQQEMHSATCAECNKRCEVPFRPSGDKPVYCSDCFKSQGGDRNPRDSGRRDFNKGNNRTRYENKSSHRGNTGENYNALFEKLNYKLDKILKILSADTIRNTEHEKPLRNIKERESYKQAVDTKALKNVLAETLKDAKKVPKTNTPAKQTTKKKTVKKASIKKTTAKKNPAKKVVKKKAPAKKNTKKTKK